jgi:RNA polymerase sigma-70 factor (ECF subfamily)
MKTLIADYQSLWFSIAHKYTNNYHQSEELVQEALSRYLESGNKEVDNIKAYVAKTIYHLYISQIRKEKSAQGYTRQLMHTGNVTVDGHNGFENQSEALQMLLKMYHLLTPAERAVFVLKKAFDIEYETLETLLQLSNDNCRQLLRRAKTKMQCSTSQCFAQDSRTKKFIDAFFMASQKGKVNELILLLQEDVRVKNIAKKSWQSNSVSMNAVVNSSVAESQRA